MSSYGIPAPPAAPEPARPSRKHLLNVLVQGVIAVSAAAIGMALALEGDRADAGNIALALIAALGLHVATKNGAPQ